MENMEPNNIKDVEKKESNSLFDNAKNLKTTKRHYNKIMKRVLIRNWFLVFRKVIQVKIQLRHPERILYSKKIKTIKRVVDKYYHDSYVRPKVYGLENVPEDLSGAVFMANHQGVADCPYLVVALAGIDKQTSFLTSTHACQNKIFNLLAKYLEASVMDIENPRSQVKVFKELEDNINIGKRYIIFPEAKYTNNHNNLQEWHAPSMTVPLKTHCPIFPVCIYDSWKMYEIEDRKWIDIEWHILKPIYYDEYKDLNKKQLAEYVKGKVEEKMNELKALKETKEGTI